MVAAVVLVTAGLTASMSVRTDSPAAAGLLAEPNVVDFYDGELSFNAPYGINNRITMAPAAASGRIRIRDEAHPVAVGAGGSTCRSVSTYEVECVKSSIRKITIDADNWDDRIVNLVPNSNPNLFIINGGTGNDVIYGGPGRQSVFGGPEWGFECDLYPESCAPGTDDDQLFGGCETTCDDGGDYIDGSYANDSLDGGPGDDVLVADRGIDTYSGGPGFDTVDYYTNSTGIINIGVRVSFNGIADDGREPELENIPSDVEGISGSNGPDRLIGDSRANLLHGNGGNDIVDGGVGRDTLHGGTGNDEVLGGWGDDTLYGGLGDDRLIGDVWSNGTHGTDRVIEYPDEGTDWCQAETKQHCESTLPG